MAQEMLVVYGTMVVVFTELSYFFSVEHRILLLSILFFIISTIKAILGPQLDYLYILTHQANSSVITAGAVNSFVALALLLINIFLPWRCVKCSRHNYYYRQDRNEGKQFTYDQTVKGEGEYCQNIDSNVRTLLLSRFYQLTESPKYSEGVCAAG